MPSPGYRVSGKEVEVRDSSSQHHQLGGCCDLQLIQSHVAPSHGPPAGVLSPLSSWQSLSCCLSRVAKRSIPKPRGPLPCPSEPHGTLLFYFRTTWTFIYLLASEPHGSPIYFRAAWSTLSLLWSRVVYYFLQSRMVSSFLPQHLVVLPQSAIPASIPVFFQLYWAAIVSLGRCGPMAWSQSSPSFHAGPVTRGSCFLDQSWVEVTPISLAQSRATAI